MPHAILPLFESHVLPEEAYAAASASPQAVSRFESALAMHCNRRHAIATQSGQTAMWAALAGLGIKAGDEVICSALIPGGTLLAILALGATPVFVDINLGQLVADAKAVDTALTARSRAIIVVVGAAGIHGVEAVAAIARRLEIPLIEDGGQAFGSSVSGRMLGAIGRVSVFDFGAGAPLTTLNGGALLTDDDKLADMARRLLQPNAPGHRLRLGSVMTPFAAALGHAQWQRLPDILQRRQALADCYLQHLIENPDLVLPDLQGQEKHTWPMMWVRLSTDYQAPQQAGILCHLLRHDIEAAPALCCAHQLSLPCHKAPVALPVAEAMARRTLRLPIFNRMSEDQVEQVCHTLTVAMLEARRLQEDWPEGGDLALDDE